MVNGKMCISVGDNEMMCRIAPDIYQEALEKRGCREMDFAAKPMGGYVFVSDEGLQTGSMVFKLKSDARVDGHSRN